MFKMTPEVLCHDEELNLELAVKPLVSVNFVAFEGVLIGFGGGWEGLV